MEHSVNTEPILFTCGECSGCVTPNESEDDSDIANRYAVLNFLLTLSLNSDTKKIFAFVFALSLCEQTLTIYCPLRLLCLSNIHKDVTNLRQEKEANE